MRLLEATVEQSKQQVTGLAQQLKFCTEVLQTHSENHKKEVAELADKLHIVHEENARLASLLSTSLSKSQVYDKLKFDYDRLMDEHGEMRNLVDSMSTTLTCYFDRDREVSGDSRDRAQQFSGGFFASPPCDGGASDTF